MNGRMIAVEPRTYRHAEGADISQQEQVIRLHRTKRPVLSRAFRAVEGFDAVDLEWPIFSSRSAMTGSVSILLRPERFLGGLIRPKIIRGSPLHVRVIQTDGRILYAADAAEVGRRIEMARSGSGAFPASGQARETGVEGRWSWVTVGLHGTEWRVVAVRGENSIGPRE
jgi:hypothetical protein